MVTQQEFTYSEFLRYVEATPRKRSIHTGQIEKDSEDTDMPEWYQTKNWGEAVDFTKNGWQAGIDMLATEADLAVNGTTEVQHNIVGSVVDVGAYLSGSPECMVQFVDMQERDREELVVYVQLGYSAYIKGEDALLFSKKVLGELVKLNQKYSLKLIGVFSSYHQDDRSDEFITLKDTYQNFVLNNIAFSYHPAFFRRLWFKFIETKEYRTDGYGTPTNQEEFENLCKAFHIRTAPHAKQITIPSIANIRLDWEIKNLKIERS